MFFYVVYALLWLQNLCELFRWSEQNILRALVDSECEWQLIECTYLMQKEMCGQNERTDEDNESWKFNSYPSKLNYK